MLEPPSSPGDCLTQYDQITQNATASSTALAANGAFRVPALETSHSLPTPLRIATTLLTVLMRANVRPRSPPRAPSPRAWKSVTIQPSKTLKSRLVLTPPRTRPASSTGRDGTVVRRQDAAHATQKKRHAALRPRRSATDPATEPEAAPARKPVVNSADTTPGARPCSSAYSEYRNGPCSQSAPMTRPYTTRNAV